MIDYLLKFPSKEDAVDFGLANGFVRLAGAEPVTTLATEAYAVAIIGEHQVPTGETATTPDGISYPRTAGDGQWWVLFRDLSENIPVPAAAAPFIVWSSASGEPRPTDDPSIPATFWA